MKTNKEIKPFKMRCENTIEYNSVLAILKDNNVIRTAGSGDEDTIINVFEDEAVLSYITFEKHFEEPEPELTYSEFMKLYGDEEEVFTREDMKEFAKYYGRRSKIISIENHLTNFASERTND